MRRFTFLAATSVAGAALIGSVAEGDRKSRGGEYRSLGSDATFTTVHSGGEVGPESPAGAAKLSCLDRRLPVRGL
jgi:hypothetical protein